jgi:thioesterase domain-containing protein
MPLDESVGTGVELSDLGMDSLMAIDLRSRLQRDLELELPLTVLGDHPTIEALAGCLHRMLGSTSVAAASPIAPVVALRTGAGAGSPVFFVGGVVGDGSQFRPLARALETRRAIYGLHPPGIDGSSPPTDLDRIARRHVEAIGTVAPHGPVVLVGHSFGALVAFEISQRLAAAGRPVESLVVLDAALAGRDRGDDLTEPGSTRELVAFASAFERSLEIDLRLPAAAAGADAVEAPRTADLVDRLAAAGVPFTAAEIDRMLAVYRANMTAMSRYRPDVRYPLPIELVVADDADPHVTAGRSAVASDPDLGWGCASVVGVRVRTVPGTHFTMLREPHMAALARQLTDCLAAAPDVPAQQ